MNRWFPFQRDEIIKEFVGALDLHKERIRRLQEALCECQHRDFFQANLHDEACPVYVIAAEQRQEYEPRVAASGERSDTAEAGGS